MYASSPFGSNQTPVTTNPLVGAFFQAYNACLPLAKDLVSLTMLQALADAFISAMINNAVSAQSQPPQIYGHNPNMMQGGFRPQGMFHQPMGGYVNPLELLGPIRAYLALLEDRAGIAQPKPTWSNGQPRDVNKFNITGELISDEGGVAIFDIPLAQPTSHLLTEIGLINGQQYCISQCEISPADSNDMRITATHMSDEAAGFKPASSAMQRQAAFNIQLSVLVEQDQEGRAKFQVLPGQAVPGQIEMLKANLNKTGMINHSWVCIVDVEEGSTPHGTDVVDSVVVTTQAVKR